MFSVISCQKEISDDMPPSQIDSTILNQPDSIYLIEHIQQPYEWSTTFKYDSNNRLISYGRFSLLDYTTIQYNTQNKPISVAHYKKDVITSLSVQPLIFVYNGNKIVKIIRKIKKAIGTFTSDYLTSYSNPVEISGYDSLCYNSKNQIIESYFFERNYAIPDTTLMEYKILTYFPNNDSLLQKIDSYYRDINNNFPLSYSLTCNSYDNKHNPFYNLIPLYPFLNVSGRTTFHTLSYNYTWSAGQASNFLVMSPNNNLSTSISSNLKLTYNSDSLLIRSVIGNDELEGVNYLYIKVKK